MRESVGSPGTEKETVETPADWMALKREAARSGEAPVTRRARRPMDAAAAGTWLRVPSPKRMRAAVANSKDGMGVRAAYPVGQTLGQGRKTSPGTWSRKPGTDGTASGFPAKGAGNPWQSRPSPEGQFFMKLRGPKAHPNRQPVSGKVRRKLGVTPGFAGSWSMDVSGLPCSGWEEKWVRLVNMFSRRSVRIAALIYEDTTVVEGPRDEVLCYQRKELEIACHSYLKATIGSTRTARRPGR